MRIVAEIEFEVPMATLAQLDDWGMTPWSFIHGRLVQKLYTNPSNDYVITNIKVGQITSEVKTI